MATIWGGWPNPFAVAANQKIELLVRASEFDIALECNRIVTLHQRVEDLVHRDRSVFLEALSEVVAFEDARIEAFEVQGVEPFAVEADLGFRGIEDLKTCCL